MPDMDWHAILPECETPWTLSTRHPGEYSFVRCAGLRRCGIIVSAKGEVRKRDGSKTAQAVADRCGFAPCTRVGHCRRRIRVGTKLLPDANHFLARVRLQRPREVPRSHHPQRAPRLPLR